MHSVDRDTLITEASRQGWNMGPSKFFMCGDATAKERRNKVEVGMFSPDIRLRAMPPPRVAACSVRDSA
jgi:hypothetical protein